MQNIQIISREWINYSVCFVEAPIKFLKCVHIVLKSSVTIALVDIQLSNTFVQYVTIILLTSLTVVEQWMKLNKQHLLIIVAQMVTQKRKSEQSLKNICNIGSLKCIDHQLELNYFCQTCSKWICSDCGVIDSKHIGHNLLQKEKAGEISKKRMAQEVRKADQLIYKIHTRKQKCILDLEVYKTQLKWCKTRIQQYFQSMIEKLNQQGNKKIMQYDDRIRQHDKKLDQLKIHKQNLEVLIGSQRSIGFPEIKIADQEMEANSIFSHSINKIDTINQIIPEFTNFNFEFDYSNNIDEFYQYSPYYELWGQQWRIKVYPKGNSAAEGKFLSVFLQLTNGYQSNKSRKYVYRIQLLSLNRAGSTIVKEFSSVFGSGQSWGYSDYLDLNNIGDFLHEGRLIFSVGVRNETFAGLADDLKDYTKKIEKQNKILEHLICENNYQKQIENNQMSEFESSKELSLASSFQ